MQSNLDSPDSSVALFMPMPAGGTTEAVPGVIAKHTVRARTPVAKRAESLFELTRAVARAERWETGVWATLGAAALLLLVLSFWI